MLGLYEYNQTKKQPLQNLTKLQQTIDDLPRTNESPDTRM